VGALTKALAAAQASFPALKKDKKVTVQTTKGKYGYAYADLASVVAAVRKPLADNGLAFTQTTTFRDGVLWLVTTLMHEGGGFVSGEYPLPMDQAQRDAQRFGSFLTYAKRYALSAILGIVTEDDDDGKGATGQPVVSRKQVNDLKTLMEKLGKEKGDVVALCQSIAGHKNPNKLTPEQYQKVFEGLQKRGLSDAGRGAQS
jgi:hypothetical protein